MARNSCCIHVCVGVLVCYCHCSTFNVRWLQWARKCTEKKKRSTEINIFESVKIFDIQKQNFNQNLTM